MDYKYITEHAGYVIGDWIIDLLTGDIYEISDIWQHKEMVWIDLAHKIYGKNSDVSSRSSKTSVNHISLQHYFEKAPSAQLLYKDKV